MVTKFDVWAVHPCIAHRPDQLPHDNAIAYCDVSSVGMQNFMRKSVGISNCNPANAALASVRHDTIHWCTQLGMREIDARLPIWPDVVIGVDAHMWRRTFLSFGTICAGD